MLVCLEDEVPQPTLLPYKKGMQYKNGAGNVSSTTYLCIKISPKFSVPQIEYPLGAVTKKIVMFTPC